MPKKAGDQRRNFRFALLQGTFMRINLAFADSSTVLPAFIHKLSGSDLLVGLTGSMMTAGWMWPQLLMSNLLEHRPRKMPFYALGMSIRVLAWLAVFFCTITIGEQNPMLLAACFLGLYFLSSSAMGVSTLPYMDIVSKSIEPQRRARFFSLRQLYGGFFAIWVGFLVRAVLGNEDEFTGILGSITQAFKTFTMYFIGSICNIETDLGFPYNYAFLFICSVTAAFLSFVSFLGVREPIHPVQPTRQPISEHLKKGPHFLRTDANYRRFILFRVFGHFSGMASPFYIPYALNELGLSEATIGFFIVCSALSGVISNTIWGYVGERYGVRWLLIITAGTDGDPCRHRVFFWCITRVVTNASLFTDFHSRWYFGERHDGRVYGIHAKYRTPTEPSNLHRLYEHVTHAREFRTRVGWTSRSAYRLSVVVRYLDRHLYRWFPHRYRLARDYAC